MLKVLYLGEAITMGKKKREHVVFDQMLKPKKSILFPLVNKQKAKGKKDK